MTGPHEGFGARLAEAPGGSPESVPSGGDAPGLRGQAPRAAGALGARPEGLVDRLRHRDSRRQSPRHAADAAVRADGSTAGDRPTSPPSPRAARTSRPSATRSSCAASPPSGASACSWASRTRAMVRAVTGWSVDVEELERVGERIINLERLFNVREGVGRGAGTCLPWKVMHEPIPEGPSAGDVLPARGARRDARRLLALRGWAHEGVPTSARPRRPRSRTSRAD